MARAPYRGLTPLQAVVLAAAVGAAATLISVASVTSVAYRSATLHVAIEMAATFVALLAGALLLGRFMRTPMRADLVLAGSLLLLGLTNLFFSVIPWIADEQPGSFHTWAPIAGRLLGAAGLALGALMPETPVHRPARAVTRAAATIVVSLLLVGVLAWALSPVLPAGIDPDLPPDPSGPDLVGEPAVLVAQILGLLLYAAAAAGFTRRAADSGDELITWLAAAATAAAFSRLNYFLFPSLYSEWVYTGDFLRILMYVLILVGAVRELATYQRELSEVAVHRERRRIARELHDGLAQDLAFIATQARRIRGEGREPAEQIAQAATRALGESRHAIATLARPVNGRLDSSIAQAATEVALRERVDLDLDLEPELDAPDVVHDACMRIVREAVTNAIRHGNSDTVAVRLTGRDGLRLTIEDDGPGLPREEREAGFGLTSMRERAEALGGTCRVVNRIEGGVRVEITLP